MFGYYRRPDAGDIFGTLLVILVIALIIFAFVAYFGAIILFIFLGIGVAIGAVLALVIYIKELLNALGSLKSYMGANGFTTFLGRWFMLFKVTTVNSFKALFTCAGNALAKSSGFKFLSFKKWMWLVVAPSVIIFGVGAMAAFTLLQIGIILFLVQIALYLLCTIVSLYLLVCVGFSIVKSFAIMLGKLMLDSPFAHLDFSTLVTYNQYGKYCKGYYLSVFDCFLHMYKETASYVKSNFIIGGTYPFFSIKKWFYYISAITMFPITAILSVLFVIVFSVISVPLFIAEIVWITIATVFKL